VSGEPGRSRSPRGSNRSRSPAGDAADAGPAANPDATRPGGTAAADPAPDAGELRGPELARAALEAALESARARRGAPPRRSAAGSRAGSGERRPRGYSGPGPDPRDPQPLGAVLDRLVKARGWQKPAAEATVFGSWEKVVGADIASHCRPVKLEGGELTVEAESTAWATQLRLLAGKVLASIAAEVGGSVVTKLRIHGPAAPSWSRGPRRVRGRGPRDTYG
jgi:predicted nucleic acid-binding Zn ribbon protein